jgi:hypothetical protein
MNSTRKRTRRQYNSALESHIAKSGVPRIKGKIEKRIRRFD